MTNKDQELSAEGSGYQGEFLKCGWTGELHDSFSEAEAETFIHYGERRL